MAHVSLDADIEILVSTMRNRLKANICVSILSTAAGHIYKALESCTSIAAKVKIAKSYPEFLRAGIKFLTFKQSLSDQMKMMNHLSTCHCDSGQCLYDPSRHRTSGRSLPSLDLLFDVVSVISNCIMLALNDLTQHRFRTGNVITGEQRWPKGPEDLLPHGPKDSVLGLELWVSVPPLGYIIFKLAGCLALSHVPFAREVFQPPKFTFALVRPFEHLVEAIKFHDLGDFPPAARTHFFTHPVMIIFDFLDNLSQCDLPQYHFMIVGRSWMSPILERLSTILSPLSEEWTPTRVKVLYLSAYAKAKFDPVTQLAEINFDRALIMNELERHDALEATFIMMIEARRMGCSNIPCSSASEVVHSRLCGKCNFIRFCGKKCQKEAWNCATLPHKPLCAKIHYVKETIGADNWALLWTPDVTYAQFQDMCKTNKVDPQILKDIPLTLAELAMAKSTLRESKRAGGLHIDRFLPGSEQQKLALQKLKNLKARVG